MTSTPILLVEDDEDAAELFMVALQAEGHVVAHTRDASSTLTYLRAAEAVPEVILLDWNLPGVNASGLLAAIQREFGSCDIPIVLLTADGEAKSKALALCAAGYLTKPLDTRDLVRMVAGVLRERASLRFSHPPLSGRPADSQKAAVLAMLAVPTDGNRSPKVEPHPSR